LSRFADEEFRNDCIYLTIIFFVDWKILSNNLKYTVVLWATFWFLLLQFLYSHRLSFFSFDFPVSALDSRWTNSKRNCNK